MFIIFIRKCLQSLYLNYQVYWEFFCLPEFPGLPPKSWNKKTSNIYFLTVLNLQTTSDMIKLTSLPKTWKQTISPRTDNKKIFPLLFVLRLKECSIVSRVFHFWISSFRLRCCSFVLLFHPDSQRISDLPYRWALSIKRCQVELVLFLTIPDAPHQLCSSLVTGSPSLPQCDGYCINWSRWPEEIRLIKIIIKTICWGFSADVSA